MLPECRRKTMFGQRLFIDSWHLLLVEFGWFHQTVFQYPIVFLQKVKIVTHFVKHKYGKNVVPLHREIKNKNEYQEYHHSRNGIARFYGM